MADGSWPRFGFMLQGISLRAKDPCETRSEVRVNSFFIPVKLTSLLGDRVSFSDLELDEMHYIYRPPLCNRASEDNEFQVDPFVGPPHPLEVQSDTKDKVHPFLAVQSFFSERFINSDKRTKMTANINSQTLRQKSLSVYVVFL